VRGAGTTGPAANPDGATVRFYDDAGVLVATAPITGPVGR
jgi:ribosomal protein L14